MVAQVTNLLPGSFVHTLRLSFISESSGTSQTSTSKKPKKLPKMILNQNIKNILNLNMRILP